MDTIQDYIDDRDRKLKARSETGPVVFAESGSRTSSVAGFTTSTGSTPLSGMHQETYSISHPWRSLHIRLGLLGRNVGGPFSTKRMSFELDSQEFALTRLFGSTAPWVHDYHNGVLFPNIYAHRRAQDVKRGEMAISPDWADLDGMDTLALKDKGEQIMLSVVPTGAPVDAVTSIGEFLAEGKLFSVPGKALLDGDPGGEYLNTVFGVLPNKGDLQAFHQAAQDFHGIIRQYHRDAGKVVRRRTHPFASPETVEVETTSTPPITPSGSTLSSYLCSGLGTCTTVTRTNREVWYSGAFEYFIPDDLSVWEEKFLEWNRAYGISPDPASMWQLFPFSWMTDWCLNGENSLRHLFLQSTEGATQRYGYVMCKTQVEKTITWSGLLYEGKTPIPRTVTCKINTTIKQRERVSPFGIHYRNADFTPRQLAIMAALGIAF